MRLRDAIDNMFGFIWKQPIHETLRQMRLMHVGLIISSMWLLFRIVDKLEVLDPVQAAIAYGAIAAVLIPTIWKSLNGIHERNAKDEI